MVAEADAADHSPDHRNCDEDAVTPDDRSQPDAPHRSESPSKRTFLPSLTSGWAGFSRTRGPSLCGPRHPGQFSARSATGEQQNQSEQRQQADMAVPFSCGEYFGQSSYPSRLT